MKFKVTAYDDEGGRFGSARAEDAEAAKRRVDQLEDYYAVQKSISGIVQYKPKPKMTDKNTLSQMKKHELVTEVSELEAECVWLKTNKDRFRKHLEKIAYTLGMDWTDGDFPIDEVLRIVEKSRQAELR